MKHRAFRDAIHMREGKPMTREGKQGWHAFALAPNLVTFSCSLFELKEGPEAVLLAEASGCWYKSISLHSVVTKFGWQSNWDVPVDVVCAVLFDSVVSDVPAMVLWLPL